MRFRQITSQPAENVWVALSSPPMRLGHECQLERREGGLEDGKVIKHREALLLGQHASDTKGGTIRIACTLKNHQDIELESTPA